MPDIPSFGDLFRIARDQVLLLNAKLSRDAVERPGSDANAVLAAACAAADQVVGQLLQVSAGAYLDSATGALLDRRVFDLFGIVRNPAAAGLTTVNFSLSAANPGAFVIPAGTQIQTPDGIKYATVFAVTFPAGSTGPIAATARSVLAGASQQVKLGTLTAITSSITGAPAGLTVTNPTASAGAADEETDQALRARARLFFTTARRGTLSALQAGALAVPGIVTATAIEALDSLGRPAREVELNITDAFTNLLVNYTPTPPGYQQQSQALATTVFNSLDDVRAAGIFVRVQVAQVVLQSVQLGLHFIAGSDENTAELQARAAIVNYTNTLSPGQTWGLKAALQTLNGIPGITFRGDEILSPTGDVVAQTLQVIRTTMPLVTSGIPASING